MIIFKIDNVKEFEASCQQAAWTSEPNLVNRPHNSLLERDIRSIQESMRIVYLQTNFAIRPALWIHSAIFDFFALNLKNNVSDREASREEFPGYYYYSTN